MAEKSLEEEIMIKAHENRRLARYMSSTEDLVEEQIRKAREKGAFDNLAGSGKPLDLSENPFEPVEMRMAFRMLKNNNFAPHWIELGKEIDADIDKLWQEVEYFKRYTILFLNEKRSDSGIKRFENKKASFYFEQRLVLETIYKKIVNYNIHCPTFRLGRANIDVDDEMYKVITTIEQVIEEAANNKG